MPVGGWFHDVVVRQAWTVLIAAILPAIRAAPAYFRR
jgi:hypothetical protein